MKTLQQIAAMLATTAMASTITLAQPTITTKYATKDVASGGFVFSETPVVKTKIALESGSNYASFEQVAHTDKPRDFFYNYAAIGTSKDTKYANLAAELSTVNVGGFGRTNELWLKATAKAPFSPSLEYVCDSGAESGQSLSASISKSAKVNGIDLGIEAAVGYNHHLSRDMSGISHARVDITASKQVTPSFNVSATARLQKALHQSFADTQMYQASASYRF